LVSFSLILYFFPNSLKNLSFFLFFILDSESSSELLTTINVINEPLCFIPIGNDSVAIGFKDPIIRVWNIKTKAELRQLIGHMGEVNKLIKFNDSMKIASASDD
jgi:WD40 repeat protein